MVSGGVQEGGEVKSCPPNLGTTHPLSQRAGFSSQTYKKNDALPRETPELALAVLFDPIL